MGISALATSILLATASTAQADPPAPGDGIFMNNDSTDAQFHTKDRLADATFRYTGTGLEPGNGGYFVALTQRNNSGNNPGWCRYGISITYRKGGKNGPRVTTPISWDARTASVLGQGLRCSTTHYIQRPGNGRLQRHADQSESAFRLLKRESTRHIGNAFPTAPVRPRCRACAVALRNRYIAPKKYPITGQHPESRNPEPHSP